MNAHSSASEAELHGLAELRHLDGTTQLPKEIEVTSGTARRPRTRVVKQDGQEHLRHIVADRKQRIKDIATRHYDQDSKISDIHNVVAATVSRVHELYVIYSSDGAQLASRKAAKQDVLKAEYSSLAAAINDDHHAEASHSHPLGTGGLANNQTFRVHLEQYDSRNLEILESDVQLLRYFQEILHKLGALRIYFDPFTNHMDTDIHAAFMSVIGRFSRSMNNAYLTADKGGLEHALQRHDEQALKRLLKQALLETELDELLHYARQQFPLMSEMEFLAHKLRRAGFQHDEEATAHIFTVLNDRRWRMRQVSDLSNITEEERTFRMQLTTQSAQDRLEEILQVYEAERAEPQHGHVRTAMDACVYRFESLLTSLHKHRPYAAWRADVWQLMRTKATTYIALEHAEAALDIAVKDALALNKWSNFVIRHWPQHAGSILQRKSEAWNKVEKVLIETHPLYSHTHGQPNHQGTLAEAETLAEQTYDTLRLNLATQLHQGQSNAQPRMPPVFQFHPDRGRSPDLSRPPPTNWWVPGHWTPTQSREISPESMQLSLSKQVVSNPSHDRTVLISSRTAFRYRLHGNHL